MVGEWGSAIPSYPTNSTAAGNFVSPFWMAGEREKGGMPCCRPGGSEWERMTPRIHHSHRRMSIACFGHFVYPSAPSILQLFFRHLHQAVCRQINNTIHPSLRADRLRQLPGIGAKADPKSDPKSGFDGVNESALVPLKRTQILFFF